MKTEDIIEELEQINICLEDLEPTDPRTLVLMTRKDNLMEELKGGEVTSEDIELVECPECGGDGCPYCACRGFQPVLKKLVGDDAIKETLDRR